MDDYLAIAVIQWLRVATTLPIITGWPDTQRPALPYFQIHLMTTNPVREQFADHQYVAIGVTRQDGKQQYEDHVDREYEHTIQIDGYGEETRIDLVKMKRHIDADLGFNTPVLFRDGQFEMHDVGIIQRVVEQVQEKWEPRYFTELIMREFTLENVVNEDAEIIEEAPFTITRCV